MPHGKYIRTVIDSSIKLQLHIELAKDGWLLRDHHLNRRLTLSTLLQQARARKEALSELRPLLHRVLKYPKAGEHAFELCDGIWGRTGNGIGTNFHQIHYHYLSSGTEARDLVHDLDFPIANFVFWEAGDLQVLLEERDDFTIRCFHFRTFSKNEPHPLARLPFIDIHKDDYEGWNKCSMRLYQDRLAVVITEKQRHELTDKGDVIVWNWTDGKPLLPRTPVIDAVIISRETLLCLVWSDLGLVLHVMSLSTGEVTHVLRLSIPRTSHWVRFNPPSPYNSISGLTGPEWEHMGSVCQSMPIVVPDPAVDIIVMEFRSQGSHISHSEHLLVISIQRILSQFTGYVDRDRGSIYDWEDWGRSAATWLPWGMYKASTRTTFCSKVLVSAWISPESSWKTQEVVARQKHLVLLEFNPRVQTNQTDEYTESLFKEIKRWTIPLYDTFPQRGGLSFVAKVWSMEQLPRYREIYLHGNGFIARKRDDYDIYIFSSPAVRFS